MLLWCCCVIEDSVVGNVVHFDGLLLRLVCFFDVGVDACWSLCRRELRLLAYVMLLRELTVVDTISVQ